MGLLPRVVLARAGRARGDHPRGSFSAIGPLAHQIIARQTPTDVYAPLEDLANAGGAVLLMGVGLDRMTLLHLAEARAGREMFRRWVLDTNGVVVESLMGGCSAGFVNLDPVLGSVEARIGVGSSSWRAYPARESIELAADAIRGKPSITHCGRECARCDAAVAGGPVVAP